MNWFAEIIKNLFDFFKDILTLNISLPDEIKEMPQQPEPPAAPSVITPGERLYLMAKSCLGTDASPQDKAPDEYACMETIDEIHKKAFGFYINGSKNIVTVSTYQGLQIMKQSPLFTRVYKPEAGVIIIAATSTGNGNLANGHIGLYLNDNEIASNNSKTGKFETNYTTDTWHSRYTITGGFPNYLFKRI